MDAQSAAQLYTLRDYTKTAQDLRETLRKVRDIGYQAVQFSAVGCMNGDSPDVTAAEARGTLDDNGLKCIATHRGWGELVNHTDAEIEFHRTLGCGYTAIGGIPAEYRQRGAEGYSEFARAAVQLAAKLNPAGITFGYHNHAHEFVRIGPGQKTLYDILIEEGGDRLALEIDTYWVQHAGASPERLIERCAGRVPVIHVKDRAVDPKEGPIMAPLGEGNLDWKHILPACRKAGVQWYTVEQDQCYRDPFDCLKSSFDFLRSHGL